MKKAREGANKYRRIRKPIVIEAKTEGQRNYLENIDLNDITICNGPAGTGKSICAIARALQYYQEAPETYKKIIIVRPAIQACDEDLGYLPGDVQEKMGPYLGPIVYSMQKFMDVSAIQELFHTGIIEVMPIAFMRGITFNNCVVVFDESQNSTIEQMKLFLTRIGEDCKAIVEGDVTQSDLHGSSKENNGLKDAMKRLKGVEGIGIVQLAAVDIVRSKVVARILEKYESI